MDEGKRPWGAYVVLSDEADHKVKRIVVAPGQRLSLQSHARRSEHWYFVQGTGVVTRASEQLPVHGGDAIDIPQGAAHRVENTGNGPLVFVEIQRGDYFGEDDIVRLEDDYGRA